jgi:hypothetical protein
MRTRILLLSLLPISLGLLYPVYGEELKILESQLNKNSITGVLQNPYNYTIGGITVRAEFYDKDDGHLVGVRDFGYPAKDELEPNEKSSYKIPEYAGNTTSFPNTRFIVKAEGTDFTNTQEISFEEMIGEINNLSSALKGIPEEVTTTITVQNESHIVNNATNNIIEDK